MPRPSRGNFAFRLQNNLLYRDIIVTPRRRDFYFGSTRRGIDRHGDDGDHSSKVDLYLEYSEFSALITNHCPCFCCLVVQNVLHGHLFWVFSRLCALRWWKRLVVAGTLVVVPITFAQVRFRHELREWGSKQASHPLTVRLLSPSKLNCCHLVRSDDQLIKPDVSERR